MANNNANSSDKVEVNGEEAALDPTRRNRITLALVQNGGRDRILAKLKQAVDEIGWSQTVRDQTDILLRSGECVTYDDLKQRLLQMVKDHEDGPTREGSTPTNMHPTNEAMQYGAAQVRKELEGILEIKKKPVSRNNEDDSDNDENNPSQAAGGAASASIIPTSSATKKQSGCAEVGRDHVKARTKEMEIAHREEEARADPSAKRKTRTGMEF